jgi:glyoxylase-like metal-dependent hydrolase (beta-lactamase superfamily II)
MTYSRRSFLKASTLGIGAAALVRPQSVLGARRAAVFTPLRRNVGIFTERGGTVGWLINSDGVVVIDSQFADTAPMIVSGIQERTRLPIDVLINTHQHPDHTGGNGVMRDVVGRIVAHERAAANLRSAAAQRGGGAAPDPRPLPDTTFATTWSVAVGDETVRLRHFGPAHTGGDAAIFFERANVVHLGDLLNNRGWPNIDAPAGGSVHGWVEVLEAIMPEYPADALYIFGHNESGYPPTGTRTDLAFQRDYFLAVIEVAATALREGRPREEAIARQTLPGFEHFGGQVPRLALAIGIAYDELQAMRR